jgi:hypothetical protein
MDSTVTTMVLVVKADILDPVPLLFQYFIILNFVFVTNPHYGGYYYFVAVLLMLLLSIASILSSISVSLCLIRFVN